MRWVWRALVSVVIGTLLLILSLWFYLFEFDGAERIVNAQVEALLEPQRNLDIHVGNISGDLLSGIVLEDVTIRYVDTTHTYLLASIRRIVATYSLANLWNELYLLDYAIIDSADVRLEQDSLGNWLLPNLTSDETGQDGRAPPFSIGDLKLIGASLTIVRPQDTIVLHDIMLDGAIEGREQTYAANLRRLQFASPRKELNLSTASGRVTYARGLLVFQDVETLVRGTRVKLNGQVTLGELLQGEVEFDINNADISSLGELIGSDYTGLIDATGVARFSRDSVVATATLAGEFMFLDFEQLYIAARFADSRLSFDTLYGTIFNTCTFDGSGTLDLSGPLERYQLDAVISNFNLNVMLDDSFESDLTGRLALAGESFSEDDMKIEIETELHDSHFDQYPVHYAAGTLLITADSISFADSFLVRYFENLIYATGRIDYSGEIDLALSGRLSNLDRFRDKLFIERPGGRARVEATLSGSTEDPDLQALLVSDSIWIYDLYSSDLTASFSVRNFLTGRRGTVMVSCREGQAWQQPYDSAFLDLTLDSTLAVIDSVSLHGQTAGVDAQGLLAFGVDPMLLTIDTLNLHLFEQAFHSRGTVELTIDTLGFNFRRASIGNGSTRLAITGRLNYDESMNVVLSVDSAIMAPWIHLFDTSNMLNGLLSCQAALQGTFTRPQFTLTGSIDSLRYEDVVLGQLVVAAQYAGRLLSLDSLVVYSEAGSYRTDGTLHADLAFSSTVVERFPDQPMNLHLVANDTEFDLVYLLLPAVEQLDGQFRADYTLSGTPHDPRLQGIGYIKSLRLKYFDLLHPVFSDSAGVTLRNNKIIIDRIDTYVWTGVQKDKGSKRRATIEGEIIVKSLDTLYYDLDVKLHREFPVKYELADISGIVEGDFHIEGDSPPLVTGDMTVSTMRYLVPFADNEEGSVIMQALAGEDTWDMNINIGFPSNYWIKNEDIDAEFSGQVNLIREQGAMRLIGEIEVVRGRGYLFDKTFRLESGSSVQFVGDPRINPRLDITGYTRVSRLASGPGGELSESEQVELCIRITGTLEEPDINTCPESEFAKEDILPLLAGGYFGGQASSSGGGFGQKVSGLVTSQLSSLGARQLSQLGVETFEIDPVYGDTYDPLRARVTVGTYMAPHLYVYGRSTLSGESQEEVGFEYRFGRNLMIEGLRDEQELYHLALKLRWEF